MKPQGRERGISLTELMVAIGILSVVLAMATGMFQYFFKIKRKTEIKQTLQGELKLAMDLMCKDLREMTLLVNNEFTPLTRNMGSGRNNDINITNTGTADDDNDGDGYCNEDPIGDKDNPNTPDVDESNDGNLDDDNDGRIDCDDIDLDANDSITFNDFNVLDRGQVEGLAAGVPYTSNVIDDDNDGKLNEDKVVDATDNDNDGFDGEDPDHGIGIGNKIRYRILDGKLIKENLSRGTTKVLLANDVVGLSIICRDNSERTVNINANIGNVRSIEIIIAVSRDGILEYLDSKVYPRILSQGGV
ncbi:MAG: type II secretion system protein [bacterium]|nr:type II secretion system protein [bacterium]